MSTQSVSRKDAAVRQVYRDMEKQIAEVRAAILSITMKRMIEVNPNGRVETLVDRFERAWIGRILNSHRRTERMDAQREHDLEMLKRGEPKLGPGSHKRLKALLKAKGEPSSATAPSSALDPIGSLVTEVPGLTREEALDLAERHGF
jgi:hypothetical protein